MYPATSQHEKEVQQAWSRLLRARDEAEPRDAVRQAPDPELQGHHGEPCGAARELLDLYRPLLAPPPAGRPFVVGHLAQSLDGRIALPDGSSQWITGEADLVHTHRLRALVDAVLVGARTVEHDDPQLTVRRVEGPHPLRVVLDPRARLGRGYRVFGDGVAETLLVVREDAPTPDVDHVALPHTDGVIAPATLLAALRRRGVRRLLVEGGGVTLGHLVASGLVDRLHVAVAPLLLGHGRPSVPVPLGEALARCPRPRTRVVQLGSDWLFDCDLGDCGLGGAELGGEG